MGLVVVVLCGLAIGGALWRWVFAVLDKEDRQRAIVLAAGAPERQEAPVPTGHR